MPGGPAAAATKKAAAKGGDKAKAAADGGGDDDDGAPRVDLFEADEKVLEHLPPAPGTRVRMRYSLH